MHFLYCNSVVLIVPEFWPCPMGNSDIAHGIKEDPALLIPNEIGGISEQIGALTTAEDLMLLPH